MKKDTPGIGLIGAGFISSYHIEGLQACGAQVTAIAGRDTAKTAERASHFGIPFHTDDYRELLSRGDVDAVVIATPDHTHRTIAADALRAGRPVLLQKPMAPTSADCRAILEIAEQTGTPLYVSFMHRYFEEVSEVSRLIRDGRLGSIYSIRQRNATPGANWADWFYRKDLIGGGAMMQLGVHGIDLLQHLFGPIVGVQAATALMVRERVLNDGTLIQPDNEDLVLAIYRFASGLLATHETAYNEVAGTDRFRTEIYGERGTAWLRTERGRLAFFGGDDDNTPEWQAIELPGQTPGYRQHHHFLQMLKGEAPDDRSRFAGLTAVLVAEAVYRSAASGRWEEVQTL